MLTRGDPFGTAGDPKSSTLISLSHGELHAQLAPTVGGSIASFHSQRGAARIDWLRPASDAALRAGAPLSMGSFPLLPWCNRIRDGIAAKVARPIAMPPNDPGDSDSPHALHGLGWQRPWRVLEASPTRVRLGFSFEADSHWPWNFEAEQIMELSATQLRCTLRLTNTDQAPMPAGIGHHPYFPHRTGTRLQTTTRAIWRSDAELMPTTLDAGVEVRALSDGVALADLALDNNFTGWGRHARIEWPLQGCAIDLSAEAPLDFFVLYSPRGMDHFCAEPVSQCTDAINLSGQFGTGDLGGTVLAPGESVSAAWMLTPSWLASSSAPKVHHAF